MTKLTTNILKTKIVKEFLTPDILERMEIYEFTDEAIKNMLYGVDSKKFHLGKLSSLLTEKERKEEYHKYFLNEKNWVRISKQKVDLFDGFYQGCFQDLEDIKDGKLLSKKVFKNDDIFIERIFTLKDEIYCENINLSILSDSDDKAIIAWCVNTD